MGGLVSAVIKPVTDIVGGIIGGRATTDAASTSARAQEYAADRAAEAAAFRPVGVTTGFGSSQFTMDGNRLTGASYQLTPELEALRNSLISQAGAYSPQQAQAMAAPLTGGAAGMFGLANQLMPTDVSRQISPEAQALAQRYSGVAASLMPSIFQTGASPEAQAYSEALRQAALQLAPKTFDPRQAADTFMTEQRAVLEAGRQAELSRIRNQLAQSGRAGLSVGGTESGNIQAANPELAAYYNALAQQDLGLAATATDTARRRLFEDVNASFGLQGQALTAQQRSEAINRENMLQNLGLSLGYGTEGLRTQIAGEDLARQRFAQDLGLATGLFGTGAQTLGTFTDLQAGAYSPLQQQLALASSVEGLGQGALDIGAQLGGRAATAGATAANAILTGGLSAARTNQLAQSYSPWTAGLTGFGSTVAAAAPQIGSWFNNFITANRYGTTPGSQQTSMLAEQERGLF